MKWTVGVDLTETWAPPRTGVLLLAWEDFFRATAPRTRCVVVFFVIVGFYSDINDPHHHNSIAYSMTYAYA